MADRDERNTRLAQNAVQRRDLEMQDRLRPALEGERSSQLELGTARNQSDLRNNPFHEQEDAAESKYRAARAASDLETLPEDVAAKTEVRDLQLDQMRRQDPWADHLGRVTKDPSHMLAYDYFKETAPKEIKDPEARAKYAYAQGLRLAQDQDAVNSVMEHRALGKIDDETMNSMLESVDDPSGNHYGLRIKPEARARVRTMEAEGRMRKEQERIREADVREARMAEASRLDSINSLLRSAQKRAELGDEAAKKEVSEWEDELRNMVRGKQQAVKTGDKTGKPVDENARKALLR